MRGVETLSKEIRKWRTRIKDIVDTERQLGTAQPPAPTAAGGFRFRSDCLLADKTFAFLVVPWFGRLRRNFSGFSDFIADLPVEGGPVSDYMRIGEPGRTNELLNP